MEREAVLAAFRDLTGRDAETAAYAPGRVNLIGEHTDYNEGFVLPAAIDRGVALAARRVSGDAFTLHAVDLRESCTFGRSSLERDGRYPWADYFKGVVWALANRGFSIPACEVAVTGDIPRGAGLSSSAAYEVAAVLLCQSLGGLDLPAQEIAKLAREAENGFVGVACGIMDQMAAVFGEKGRALLLDCRSLAREAVDIPSGIKIVVVNSGVRHSLAGSEYNTRRAQCDEGVRLLSVSLPQVGSLRDVAPEALVRLLPDLPPVVAKRCWHVVLENARVHEAVAAMRSGDLAQLRTLMAASHFSLRDDYEVSCPELDILVDLALAQPRCHGARLTGAGFGGSTVNLVEAEAVESFSRAVLAGYRERSGRSADVHVFEPSAGARSL
ncbi:MAG: galactokinase [Deltaproteobacteria bacterium]|jgi:galactokinase|nr:galactokinase [Deltaproteobacteria bacterium]